MSIQGCVLTFELHWRAIRSLIAYVDTCCRSKSYEGITQLSSFDEKKLKNLKRFNLTLKKKRDISQLRSWNPSSTIRRASYLNVTALDRLAALILLRDCFFFFLWVHMKPQCNLLWYLIKPYNVLLIIKHSHLAENDSAEEITSPGFWQTRCALTIIDFSLCPGVTGE